MFKPTLTDQKEKQGMQRMLYVTKRQNTVGLIIEHML